LRLYYYCVYTITAFILLLRLYYKRNNNINQFNYKLIFLYLYIYIYGADEKSVAEFFKRCEDKANILMPYTYYT